MVGSHSIVDLSGCPFEVLDNINLFLDQVKYVLTDNNCTVLNSISHKFTPQGYTGIYLLAESHLSIHTYPELGSANIDCFTCGNMCNPEKICNEIAVLFEASRYNVKNIIRG